ncbi:hypothetical protein [Cohnella nanjingensis]|uniref:Rad50/SbcC-type AAA domain-containing protein n=1 Tax=Cohnella nanjingensis TaxID=1387779 RepID=A0A7X0VEY9_9BACL|nr:hypothetical protein [Cohnella nanjingensis]MBB6671261.1 hypothetical protein [Cohnella nanjingensis]
MLRINRLKIEINTSNGLYGFDEEFNGGLNFIASEDNTRGKSSIIASIYYCLGFEEIIGGKGEKVLTSVYKSRLEDGDAVWPVLESGAYLEITNGLEVITIYRAAKMENRDNKLITVYHASINKLRESAVFYEDMYVHMPNSATNIKGFHRFLETFLHIELPLVPATDDVTRKLYLQLIFAGMFIEQKHGWADILSGMPVLGIRESKKRVIEYILNLDTLDNEKKKDKLRLSESSIKQRWEALVKGLLQIVGGEDCEIQGLPLNPRIISEEELSKIMILKDNERLDNYLVELDKQLEKLVLFKPKIVDNFDEIQDELEATEKLMDSYEETVFKHRRLISSENSSIDRLTNSLEIIEADIRNNKDAARLRNLGSELELSTSKDKCPVCNQTIKDTLIPDLDDTHVLQVMSIDENIRHLNAQKEMLEFARRSHEQNRNLLYENIEQAEQNLFKLRRLAKSLRSDLYSTNDNLSESMVYKRIQIDNEITKLSSISKVVINELEVLRDLSDEWKEYLKDKSSLPNKKFTELDEKKLRTLRNFFIDNIKLFGYKSVLNVNEVEISLDTYLPVIEGFDMKFDSSASDNIRAIWAFILALLQTSNKTSGNHPRVLMFDEPAQHSIIVNDMEQFFNTISKVKDGQIIVGITVKDNDTRQAIQKLNPETYKFIMVPNKAFQLISDN